MLLKGRLSYIIPEFFWGVVDIVENFRKSREFQGKKSRILEQFEHSPDIVATYHGKNVHKTSFVVY